MAEWGDHYLTRYRFVRVGRETGHEVCELRVLRGGTITRNDGTDIKEKAEAEIVGDVDLGSDLVRVYMAGEWLDGTTESVALGTFIPATPTREVRAGHSVASLKLYGRLQELADDQFAAPLTVGAGESPVARAREICEGAGLTVVSDPSSHKLTSQRLYGAGGGTDDTKLKIVNDLLDAAGFRSARTDPMGRVVFERYREPAEMAASWTFAEGPSARFESSMSEERDFTSTANRVLTVFGSQESGVIVGEAVDDDPESPLSTVGRGRVITKRYTFNELPDGADEAARREAADRKARSLLDSEQSVVHRVTVSHVYAPVGVGDAVALDYPSGGIRGKFQIRQQTIRLVGGCRVQSELRRFVRRAS